MYFLWLRAIQRQIMIIWCCKCEHDVLANQITGRHVYKNRPDLWDLPFWQCPFCKNFVGCHHKSRTPTKPLGCIPTRAIKDARMEIHKIMDPIWQNTDISRTWVYNQISKKLGYEFHTAELRSLEECEQVKQIVMELKHEMA
jgi:hypothetical protein